MGKKSRTKKLRQSGDLPKFSRKDKSNIRYQPYKKDSDDDDLLQSLHEMKHLLESGLANPYEMVAQLMNQAGIDFWSRPDQKAQSILHTGFVKL